jgi:hypothetical protein
VLEQTMALAFRIASCAPGATRQIKRLMMASHQADIGAARVREEAAFAALFADSANSAQLTAGLDR